MFFVEEFLYP